MHTIIAHNRDIINCIMHINKHTHTPKINEIRVHITKNEKLMPFDK